MSQHLKMQLENLNTIQMGVNERDQKDGKEKPVRKFKRACTTI